MFNLTVDGRTNMQGEVTAFLFCVTGCLNEAVRLLLDGCYVFFILYIIIYFHTIIYIFGLLHVRSSPCIEYV